MTKSVAVAPPLEEIFRTGQVLRYHANPLMAPLGQTDADHTWGVVAIILMLHPNPSRNLLGAAVFHDSGEFWAGDLPYPFKRDFPALAQQHQQCEAQLAQFNGVPQFEITEEEKLWIKLADRVESQLYARLYRPELWKSWGVQTDILQLAEKLGVMTTVKRIMNYE